MIKEMMYIEKTPTRFIFRGLILIILMGLLAACGDQTQEEVVSSNNETSTQPAKANGALRKTNVLFQWTPNTNYTGIYVAKKLGYYEAQGLDVELLQAGELSAEHMAANQQVDFAFSYQEGLSLARASGLPLISVMAIIQHNSSGFYVKASANVQTPKDLENKTYGAWSSPVEEKTLETVMQNTDADVKKVRFINIGNTDFFANQETEIDFVWGFEAWQGVQAELEGIPFTYFAVRDYEPAFDYYTPLLITHEQMDPELMSAFVKATQKGYQYAIANPQEAADILLAMVPELDRDLVEKSQLYLASRYQADAPYFGYQNKGVYQRYNDWLLDKQLIDQPLDAEKMFTNEFLEKE